MSKPTPQRSALIAGGGIAGVAAGLALARAGWSVSVHERAASFEEVGAGLQISPNAARVLDWLGVLDALAPTAFRPERAELRDGLSGAPVYAAPLGVAAEQRWGAPYLHIHRADLLAVLLAAARTAGVTLRTSDAVARYVNTPEAVHVTMADGRLEYADLCLGADGLRSSVRTALNGSEQPAFTQQTAWRALVPRAALPEGLVAPNATVWAGPGRHVVTYYLRGGALVNLVAVEERPDWTEEDWSLEGDPKRLRAAFTGWHPAVTGLLAAVERAHVWGLFLRPEQVRWAEGRVALVGDAAHAMLPFMAQGAAMALEDVTELIRALQGAPDIPSALLAYERARWPRVARVQARSRANAKLFHKRTALGRLSAWTPIRLVSRFAPGLAAGQLDWLYGQDPTAGLAPLTEGA